MQLLGLNTSYNKMTGQARPHRLVNKIAGTSPVNVGKWERIASLALGGFLAYKAIKNRRWFSLLSGGGGAALISRGVSGVCPIYKRMGVTSSAEA